MKIPFSDVTPIHEQMKSELENAFYRVLAKEWFIQGENCEAFEREYAEYCGSRGIFTDTPFRYHLINSLNLGKCLVIARLFCFYTGFLFLGKLTF